MRPVILHCSQYLHLNCIAWMRLVLMLIGFFTVCGSVPESPAQTVPPANHLPMPVCQRIENYQLPRDFSRLLGSVVAVQNGDQLGTGVLVSKEGHILTAAHLLSDHGATTISKVAVYLSGGHSALAQVLGSNAEADVALLKIPHTPSLTCIPSVFKTLPIGSSLFSVGFLPVRNAGFILSKGVIKNYQTLEPGGLIYIQTGIDLKSGSSGGPLLDQHGRLIGIVSARRNTAEPGSISYAIPIGTAWKALQFTSAPITP